MRKFKILLRAKKKGFQTSIDTHTAAKKIFIFRVSCMTAHSQQARKKNAMPDLK